MSCTLQLSEQIHSPCFISTYICTLWNELSGSYGTVQYIQGVTKRCRLSWLTNSALVYESNCGGWLWSSVVSANEYSCAHEAQINFGDLTPYLTYEYILDDLQDFGSRIRIQHSCSIRILIESLLSYKKVGTFFISFSLYTFP
jgi:hypothetical protein